MGQPHTIVFANNKNDKSLADQGDMQRVYIDYQLFEHSLIGRLR